ISLSQVDQSVQVLICAADQLSFDPAKGTMISRAALNRKWLQLDLDMFQDIESYFTKQRSLLSSFQKNHGVEVLFDDDLHSVSIIGRRLSGVDKAYDELALLAQHKTRTTERISVGA